MLPRLFSAIAFCVLLMCAAPSFAESKAPIHFCYAAFNDAREPEQMRAFVAQISGREGFPIVFESLQKPNTDIASTLRNLYARDVHCDILVLSGHHSGSFWGENVLGVLKLDDLEEGSCRHPDLFDNIKLVYLQGCRTLGDSSDTTSDAQAQRVARAVRHGRDQGDVDYLTIALGFDTIYDSYSPIAERESAIFPHANILGYAGTARSSVSASPQGIIEHIERVRQQLSQRDHRPVSYYETLRAMIDSVHTNDSQLVLQAWHARPEQVGQRGIALDTAEAQPSRDLLQQRCRVAASAWSSDNEQALQQVLASRESLQFNFSLVRRYLMQDATHDHVLQILRRNALALQILKEKLDDPQLSFSGRMITYDVYREVLGSNQRDPYFSALVDKSLDYLELPTHSSEVLDLKAAILQAFPVTKERQPWLTTRQRSRMWSALLRTLQDGELNDYADDALAYLRVDGEFVAGFTSALHSSDTAIQQRLLHSYGPWMQAPPSALESLVMRTGMAELKDSLFAPVDPRFVALMLSSRERLSQTLASVRQSQALHRQLMMAVIANAEVPLLRVQRREALADPARLNILLRELVYQERKQGPLTLSDDFVATLKGVMTPQAQDLLLRTRPASFTSDMLATLGMQSSTAASASGGARSIHDR